MSNMLNTYSLLTIDLDAIAANYSYLRKTVNPSTCAVVLKADSYGLGIEAIAPVFYNEGCRHFFVAYINEAIALKNVLSVFAKQTSIYILNGPYLKGWENYCHHHRFIPVLNSLEAIQEWQDYGKKINLRMPAALHIDTGMRRLALPIQDYNKLLQKGIDYLDLRLVMSHLSCADEKENHANSEQLAQMNHIRKNHLSTPISLANSSGIFLNASYHFDMVRPGIALYGYNSVQEYAEKLSPCLELEAIILQIQDANPNEYVGYNRTFQTTKTLKLATLAIGYADGVPWSMSNQGGYVLVKGRKAPIVGRISMDVMSIDITDIPGVSVGDRATLLGKDVTLDHWANIAGSSSYELLLKFGKRLRRVYATEKQHIKAELILC